MQLYERGKKFITWLMNGIAVLLVIAIVMDVNICGYAAATIFWDIFIPIDITLLVIVLVVEKIVKK